MPAYKEYQQEHEIYKDIHIIRLENILAKKIGRKIERHFKINYMFVNKKPICKCYHNIKTYFNRRTWSIAYSSSNRIEFMNQPNLLTVAHEYAHILANRKYGVECNHNKKFKRELKRICKYIRKKNLFNNIIYLNN